MEELAARAVPPATASQINKLEKGHTRMTIEWMHRLARALECHPAELLPDAPIATPAERALVELYRGLAEPERRTLFRVADAMAKPEDADEAGGDNRKR